MASSQVEIVSSSPFGRVLRDRNRRDGCRESKWRKFLVKDQNLHPCISVPRDSSASSNENENSCWLPTNQRFSGDVRTNCSNSNIKESSSFPSRKDKEMETPKAESKPQETLLLPRSDILAPETPNLGAASLVQIWEKRLNRSNSLNNSNSAISPDSGLGCNGNNASSSSSSSSSSSPRSSKSETGHSVFEERFDSSADWHSDRTAPSEQPSPCQSRNSDAGESERVRVADIIKRLTASNPGQNTLSCSTISDNDNGHEQSTSPCDRLSPRSDQMEQRIFSPRIRGRQAFADLLMQMEKERHGELNVLIERKAVSRFAQKGRIQSMLRLRLLQRGTAIQDPQRPRFAAASHQVERLPQGSTIMHLRERFTVGAEHGTTSQSDATTDPRSPRRETIKDAGNFEKSSIPNRPDVQIQNQEGNFIEQQDRTTIVHDPPAHDIEEIHNEPVPLTPVQETRTVLQDPPVHNTKDVHGKSNPLTPVQDTITLIQDPPEHYTEDIHEEPGLLTPIQDKITTVQDPQAHNIEDTHVEPGPSSSITWQETSSDYRNPDAQETESEGRNLASQETADTADATTFCGGWDGNDVADLLEDNYQEYAETSYDWISDISRPRSYWEDRRQEWYHEVLNSNSENAEIRRLLERGTVSSFLASDFRERMDRLMETRLEIRQARPAGGSQGGEDDEGHSELMSFIQNHRQQKQQQEHKLEEEEIEREERERGEVQVEEEETFISGQYHEASDYFDQPTLSPLQVPLQSLRRSWSFQDNEVGDESDRAPSTSPCQDFRSQSYHPNAWQCTSSTNHPSIEMELICELRGQMEQLHQEMSELRKSVKSCMDMQMILMQNSMKQEVHSVSVEGGEKKSSGRAVPKKGNCCICYEMKVDSLLYRCGHMCTCQKCALELQWSSGKCPICRAPIEDVVRAYLELDS